MPSLEVPVDVEVLQRLLDRMNGGDRDAREDLFIKVYDLVTRRTESILRGFPDLARIHSPNSVFHDVWGDVHTALARVNPETVRDLLNLIGHKVRLSLIDAVQKLRRAPGVVVGLGGGGGADGSAFGWERGDTTYDPAKLAVWSEFHEAAEDLPGAEREVFSLYFYSGLSKVAVAEVLGVSTRDVRMLWMSATERLLDALPESARHLDA